MKTMDDVPKSSSIRREYAMHPMQLGYRMPAEWESHLGSFVAWPHNHQLWPGRLNQVEGFFAKLIALLSQFETAHVIVRDEAMERHARLMLRREGPQDVTFHHFRTNTAYVRDHGATFVRRDSEDQQFPPRIAIDWGFNGWGNKAEHFESDGAVAHRMAQATQMPCVSGGMIFEGGAIETNGQGTAMTLESCVLNRNPGITRSEATETLNKMLGTSKVLWLSGGLAGDATGGHIDQLARFVSANQIVVSMEEDETDENYRVAQSVMQQLQEATDIAGKPFEIHSLPVPAMMSRDGNRLPASYANFYIANSLVLVPQFSSHRDDQAIETLSRLFPDRRIVGLDCTEVLTGYGSIHRVTQQLA